MQQGTGYLWLLLTLSIPVGVMLGCSSGSSPTPVPAGNSADTMPVGSGPSADAPGLVVGPGIAVIVEPAGTDLKVAYSDPELQESVGIDYIVSEWQKVKTCLETTFAAPYVLVVDGWLKSEESDDVLFNFEGRRLASATWNDDNINVVRISSYDFDGSQGNAGFNLRSILGRYLWTLNELPVSEYDTTCASGS